MLDVSKYIVHDLTHTFHEGIAGYSDQVARTLEADGWNAKTLTIYSHAGTHIDAPHHFGVSDLTIEKYDPIELMGKAHIIDVPIYEANQLIQLNDVVTQLDNFTNRDSILIRTNWSKKYDQIRFKKDLPRISEDLAIWCSNNKVKLLGVEPPSVADVADITEVTLIHRILFQGGVIIIEGLKNLDKIMSKEVFLIAMPLKIKNGDGSPARVIAFEEKKVD